jgi:hypothetical protein
MKKRGMSEIVMTVIMVSLVLVAVAIVWAVLGGFIETGTEDIEINAKCLKVDFDINSVDCTNSSACLVNIQRKAGGEEIAGLKVVFKTLTNSSDVLSVEGNIEPLQTITPTLNSGIENITKVEVTAYFLTDDGKELICSQAKEYNF